MNKTSKSLIFEIPPTNCSYFFSLLQYQIFVPTDGTKTIRSLLCELPGFSEEYIRETVQTIFINGSAADNVDQALTPGDKLSLSAAMPGLAGAIFRRGGQHKSLRSKVTATKKQKTIEKGYVILKLFNSIASDRGQELLTKGIFIEANSIFKFLKHRQESAINKIERIVLEGQQVNLEKLLQEDNKELYYNFRIAEQHQI